MTLSNNQFGRLQLLLQEVLQFQRKEFPDTEDAERLVDDIIYLFPVEELQKISSDMKDIYNCNKYVKIICQEENNDN